MPVESVAWSIFFLPVAVFIIIALLIRPFFDRYSLISGLLLIGALLLAFCMSVWVLLELANGTEFTFTLHQWLDIGSASIEIGILLDPLTAIMLVVVTGVSLMVQIYSLGYMKGDPGFSRYFAYMALFTAAMIGLVLSANVIQLYAFWELVGLASYLLIGFWHDRPSAAAAAKKAFIITRIGDVGLLISIILLFFHADQFASHGLNAFNIRDIWEAAQPVTQDGLGILIGPSLILITLGIFAGAAGKSGQFPLHTWLPDAMEGPTPVSALIHAATMVAAGVFLVGRFFPVFQQASHTMMVIALIGGFTAIMAATMGLVMNDIKRVMAYSTISQLGYMMAALGLGAYWAALFHLVTHAFFKALLFLCAGSVNHASGTFNMLYMGGLRREMPLTYVLTLVGGLSLVGIVPLAGFWSKDEILLAAWIAKSNWVGAITFIFLILGVFVTAFYTFRMLFMTFHGRFRGGVEQEHKDLEQHSDIASTGEHVHLVESPWVMLSPMLLLGLLAVVAGFLFNPQWISIPILEIPKHWITEFLVGGLAFQHPNIPEFNFVIAIMSTIIAVSGIVLAGLLYLRPQITAADRVTLTPLNQLANLLSQKYYVDHLYEQLIVRRWFYRGLVTVTDWFDRVVIDGIVDLIGNLPRGLGRMVIIIQTGQVQFYGIFVILATLVILAMYLILATGIGS